MDKIKFARISNKVKIPTKREEDGCYDVYAYFEEDYVIINPNSTRIIPTGLYSSFSKKYLIQLNERGSTGTKGIGQRAGIIDSGYRNEWMIPITNHNDIPLIIIKKEAYEKMESMIDAIFYPYEKAICQFALIEVPKVKIEEISLEELKSIPSERGEGKLGSSGK